MTLKPKLFAPEGILSAISLLRGFSLAAFVVSGRHRAISLDLESIVSSFDIAYKHAGSGITWRRMDLMRLLTRLCGGRSNLSGSIPADRPGSGIISGYMLQLGRILHSAMIYHIPLATIILYIDCTFQAKIIRYALLQVSEERKQHIRNR